MHRIFIFGQAGIAVADSGLWCITETEHVSEYIAGNVRNVVSSQTPVTKVSGSSTNPEKRSVAELAA